MNTYRDTKKNYSLLQACKKALGLYRSQFKATVLISMLNMLLFESVSLMLLYFGLVDYHTLSPIMRGLAVIGLIGYLFFIGGYLTYILSDFSLQAVDARQGERVDFKVPSRENYTALLGSSFLYLCYVFLGVTLFIIPGIFIALKLFLYSYVVVDQHKQGKDALIEAWHVSSWPVMWRIALVALMVELADFCFFPLVWIPLKGPFLWYLGAALYRQSKPLV